MATALYRKYRPQLWADITNQNHVKVTLQNELERGRLAHAYLFAGPRGVGKTTVARILAKAVNCENRKPKESEPCNQCRSCKEIMEGRSIDLIEIDAASHTGVDHVREYVIASARFTPTAAPFKVFIIDEVHMLSISAFNALLKTLEEPPPRVLFIFATTEVYKLPPTIVSRCQRFDFKKINREEIVERLSYLVSEEGVEVPREILETIAKHADGFVRDAEGILGQVLSLGNKSITLSQAELILPKAAWGEAARLLAFMADKNIPSALRVIHELQDQGGDLVYFTLNLIEFLRKILVVKIGETGSHLDDEETKHIEALRERFSLKEVVGLIELFLQAKDEMRTAFIPQLPLELAVVKFCTGETPAVSL